MLQKNATAPLIEAVDISKRFTRKLDIAEKIANLFGAGLDERIVRAVDGVSLAIRPGEVVGLVGESGCGKSTLGRVLAGIHPQSEGELFWEGRKFSQMTPAEAKAARLSTQMIFQDPMSSLNPRKTVAQAIGEAPTAHGMVSRREAGDMVAALMERVGLDPSYARRYPHQFSGGQRQRIGIARALAVRPRFLICDESVSALDVSIQAQVLNLFMELRRELGLTYLFISHDLGVVKHISDRVAIMYLGKIVELGDVSEVYERPNHPYTVALLSAIPRPDPQLERQRERIVLRGDLPSPIDPPTGCRFHTRCWLYRALDEPEVCRVEEPPLVSDTSARMAACHFTDDCLRLSPSLRPADL
jgi:oligopeptide/dipeptide ABC transporter ATP-binding protein